ncbi:hypothetical protein Ac2012v2_000615 [Leucoagaricus gongylophorus]
MRVLSALVFASLSLSTFSLASPLENQVVLLDKELVEEPHWKYSLCDNDEDPIVNIKSIQLSPDSPSPGKELTVKVKAEASETIEDGAYAEVTVKLGLIKLLSKEFDLCEEAHNANTSVQCPVAPGLYEVQQTVSLPKEIPPAKFQIRVESFSVDDELLFCLDIEADFRWRFPHRG